MLALNGDDDDDDDDNNNLTAAGNHMPYGIIQCYLPPGSDFPALSQPKLVLDLATPDGCKAEFT